jgi:hypothetical protein
MLASLTTEVHAANKEGLLSGCPTVEEEKNAASC